MPEQTPDTFLSLFWSYTSVWVVLAVYIGWLGVRLSRLEKILKSISEKTTNDKI